MNNLLLRLINRSTLGPHTIPGASQFTWAPEDEQALREALGCSEESSWVNPLLVVRHIDAFSWLAGRIPEPSRSYDGLLGVVPLFTPGPGVSLLETEGGARATVRNVQAIPVSTRLDIEDLGGSLRVSIGNRRETVGYTEADGVLTPDWPGWTGVTGRLAMEENTGYIDLRPLTLDYTGTLHRVENNYMCLQGLQRAGLTGAYHSTSYPEEKLGIAGVALAILNDRVRFL